MIIDEIRRRIKQSTDSNEVAILELVEIMVSQEGDYSDEIVERIIKFMIRSNLQTVNNLLRTGCSIVDIRSENAILNSLLLKPFEVQDVRQSEAL